MAPFGLLAALILTLPDDVALLFGSAGADFVLPTEDGPVGGFGTLDMPGLDAADIVFFPLGRVEDGLYVLAFFTAGAAGSESGLYLLAAGSALDLSAAETALYFLAAGAELAGFTAVRLTALPPPEAAVAPTARSP